MILNIGFRSERLAGLFTSTVVPFGAFLATQNPRGKNKREIAVWLDQGWSYWSFSQEMRNFSHMSFDSNLSPESTGKVLAEFGVNVQGHDLPTFVFIE